MKKTTILVLVLVIAVVWVVLARRSNGDQTDANAALNAATVNENAAVDIRDMAFAPSAVSVKAGSTVTWTNNDSVHHTVVGVGFSSEDLAPGASFAHTFSQAGTFSYRCGIHPTMQGQVIVQ